MLISAVSLLDENPFPSVAEIKEALNRVLCRYGTHSRFIKAVQLTSEKTQNNQAMTLPNFPNSSRGSFLKNTVQLLIGFNLLPLTFCQTKSKILGGAIPSEIQERSSMGPDVMDFWIGLDAEGKVTVLTGKMELGQGIRTALMQMAAEELEVNMDIVSIINVDTGQTADKGYTARKRND